MKWQVWFQTDLGYNATKTKLRSSGMIVGDSRSSKGRLTFYLKDFKDITFQITTKGKLGIYYPEEIDYKKIVEQIKPLIGLETMVLTVQNGVEAPERIGGIIGSEHVVPGVSRTNSYISAPGEVTHNGGKHIVFGEFSGIISPRVKKLEKAFKNAMTLKQ